MAQSLRRPMTDDDEARLRAQGLIPVTHWLPDIDSPTFRAEAHRQSLAARSYTGADDDQAFIDSIGNDVWE